jgi:uncharacterized protein YrrD
MIKSKDFYLVKVYDTKGKYLGTIEDMYINFYEERVEGFSISNFFKFSKKNFVKKEDIISMEEVIIARNLSFKIGIPFKSIKDMDIKDKKNVMKGVLEELIIEKEDFSIKGLIMSSGIFDKMFKGKEILLLKNCILGEDFILYKGCQEVSLKSMPRSKKE